MYSINDNPIKNKYQDTTGRAKVVGSFVKNVLNLDVSEGCVVAVVGD